MKMKECTHKDHVGDRLLPITEFYKRSRSKTGYASECKTCTKRMHNRYHETDEYKASVKRSYERNKEQIKDRVSSWQENNKDKVNDTCRKYRENNAEARRESTRKWREENKALVCFLANKRRAAKVQATPAHACQDTMKEIYRECDRLTKETGIQHHVHHIVPLQELDFVCGLHCQQNLMILTDEEHKLLHSKLELLMEHWY